MTLLLAFLFLSGLTFAETIYVAVASSLRPVMEEVVPAFERQNPDVRIKLSYSSSGNLYRQILGGAPYHLFLSADTLYTDKLHRKGLSGNPKTVAYGRLAVFSLNKAPKKVEDLLNYERISLANPRHAPYGKSAVEFLKKSGLHEKLKNRLVYGSNVAQAFQFVVAGGVGAGIVSLSLAVSYSEGEYWMVPQELYSPIQHSAVLTNKGLKSEGARKLFEFLSSEDMKNILKRFRFGVP